MRRDFSSGSLYQNPYRDEEDADPRVGLVNLADVMLVFACGLMLALVSYWNLDLPNVAELDQADMQEVDNVQEMTEVLQSSSSSYMELGKVYQDPKTGQLYVMTETQEDAGSSDGGGDASADELASSQDGSSNVQGSDAGTEAGSDGGSSL